MTVPFYVLPPEFPTIPDNASAIYRAHFQKMGASTPFDWDNMGAAEFEYSALRRTLKLSRGLHALHPMEVHAHRHGPHVAYSVAAIKGHGVELAQLVFINDLDNRREWLGPTIDRKELTHIRSRFLGNNPERVKYPDCWLNTYFRQPENREEWQEETLSVDLVELTCLDEKHAPPLSPLFPDYLRRRSAPLPRLDVTTGRANAEKAGYRAALAPPPP